MLEKPNRHLTKRILLLLAFDIIVSALTLIASGISHGSISSVIPLLGFLVHLSVGLLNGFYIRKQLHADGAHWAPVLIPYFVGIFICQPVQWLILVYHLITSKRLQFQDRLPFCLMTLVFFLSTALVGYASVADPSEFGGLAIFFAVLLATPVLLIGQIVVILICSGWTRWSLRLLLAGTALSIVCAWIACAMRSII